MAIVVVPAQPGDVRRLTEIKQAAFANDRLEQLLCASESDEAEAIRDDIAKPTVKWAKAVDIDTQEIIACAKWIFYTKDQPPLSKQLEVIRKAPKLKPHMNADVLVYVASELARAKVAAINTEPHCYLSSLATDPKHQNRGAASQLLRWGCQIADRWMLKCYLESTEASHRLYELAGFKDHHMVSLDLSSTTNTPKDTFFLPVMVREPVCAPNSWTY